MKMRVSGGGSGVVILRIFRDILVWSVMGKKGVPSARSHAFIAAV